MPLSLSFSFHSVSRSFIYSTRRKRRKLTRSLAAFSHVSCFVVRAWDRARFSFSPSLRLSFRKKKITTCTRCDVLFGNQQLSRYYVRIRGVFYVCVTRLQYISRKILLIVSRWRQRDAATRKSYVCDDMTSLKIIQDSSWSASAWRSSTCPYANAYNSIFLRSPMDGIWSPGAWSDGHGIPNNFSCCSSEINHRLAWLITLLANTRTLSLRWFYVFIFLF